MNAVEVWPWSDQYLLGHDAMDATHHEFVALVNQLLTVEDAALERALWDMAQHIESHFAQEKAWMESSGFPASSCHVEEHEKVQASLDEVQFYHAQGNAQVVRAFASALQEWFPAHADYMDSALAVWMVKQQYAAAPLVFRRSIKKDP